MTVYNVEHLIGAMNMYTGFGAKTFSYIYLGINCSYQDLKMGTFYFPITDNSMKIHTGKPKALPDIPEVPISFFILNDFN